MDQIVEKLGISPEDFHDLIELEVADYCESVLEKLVDVLKKHKMINLGQLAAIDKYILFGFDAQKLNQWLDEEKE